jgi:hypothetical protein
MSLSKSAGASETAAQIGKLPLGRRIGDDGIDRDVQFVDNLLCGQLFASDRCGSTHGPRSPAGSREEKPGENGVLAQSES